MKKLLITLLLISPFSFADWGDVYYCQMTNLVVTRADGTVEQYKLEKFQFKLDKEKNAMVFGNGGYFGGTFKPLDSDVFPNQEYWIISEPLTAIKYNKGKFLYAGVYVEDIISMTANCDKF